MAGLLNATLYLINTLFMIYIWVLILRVLLQFFRADPYNPISQIVGQVTRIPVGHLQRVIPRWKRLDLAACVYALVVTWIYIEVVYSFLDQRLSLGLAIGLAFRELAVQILNVYSGSLLIYVLLSWFGQGMSNPVGSVLWSINEPLLRPVRRIFPPYSGLDFSPMIVILALQVVRIVVESL